MITILESYHGTSPAFEIAGAASGDAGKRINAAAASGHRTASAAAEKWSADCRTGE
jgi:hypothetical protein